MRILSLAAIILAASVAGATAAPNAADCPTRILSGHCIGSDNSHDPATNLQRPEPPRPDPTPDPEPDPEPDLEPGDEGEGEQ